MKAKEVNIADLANKTFLSAREAAVYMGIGKSQLYKLTSMKRIQHSKPTGKLVFFERTYLEEWMRQNTVEVGEVVKGEPKRRVRQSNRALWNSRFEQVITLIEQGMSKTNALLKVCGDRNSLLNHMTTEQRKLYDEAKAIQARTCGRGLIGKISNQTVNNLDAMFRHEDYDDDELE